MSCTPYCHHSHEFPKTSVLTHCVIAIVIMLLPLQDQGLSVGLLLMMQHLVDLSAARRAAAAAAAAATAASPGSSSKGKKGKKQAAAVHDKAPPASVDAAGDDDQESWLPELMASLCEKVGTLAMVHAAGAMASLCGRVDTIALVHAVSPVVFVVCWMAVSVLVSAGQGGDNIPYLHVRLTSPC